MPSPPKTLLFLSSPAEKDVILDPIANFRDHPVSGGSLRAVDIKINVGFSDFGKLPEICPFAVALKIALHPFLFMFDGTPERPLLTRVSRAEMAHMRPLAAQGIRVSDITAFDPPVRVPEGDGASLLERVLDFFLHDLNPRLEDPYFTLVAGSVLETKWAKEGLAQFMVVLFDIIKAHGVTAEDYTQVSWYPGLYPDGTAKLCSTVHLDESGVAAVERVLAYFNPCELRYEARRAGTIPTRMSHVKAVAKRSSVSINDRSSALDRAAAYDRVRAWLEQNAPA